MASIYWKGGAAAVAQLNTYTFAGTWLVGETVTFTTGVKSFTYAVTSVTIATFLPLLAAAYNALAADAYPELAEQTAGSTSTTLTLAAKTAGEPFSCTVSTNSAAGTVNGGSTSAGTATVASSGPNDWSTAANWSAGAVPVSSDTVTLENGSDAIKYGLAQSGVTLTLLNAPASWTGPIGLPVTNADGTPYPEYRARALAIGATTCNVGLGDGAGSGRLILNFGSVQTTLNVYATGSSLDDGLAALQWKGTHASNVVNVYKGSADVAWFAAETAVIATLRVGYESSQDGDAAVRVGSGATLTTVAQNGGTLVINSAATTITKYAGTLTSYGSGAITTVSNYAGDYHLSSTGTVTTYNAGAASALLRDANLAGVTITNVTVTPGATITDDGGTITFTNGIPLGRGLLSDFTFNFGFNRTITPS